MVEGRCERANVKREMSLRGIPIYWDNEAIADTVRIERK